ncbi:hypothetical protein HPB50_006932 [Hyalomma asiaticum]|uniref:Uncharacterized protein n=1 Tax=Hyalomma asiaticum TaxID=266040 RepID=A0ACB7T8A2_HYAAI|nr:hypothetical protein HPB50_006932 [Hyalomma asiaticum]
MVREKARRGLGINRLYVAGNLVGGSPTTDPLAAGVARRSSRALSFPRRVLLPHRILAPCGRLRRTTAMAWSTTPTFMPKKPASLLDDSTLNSLTTEGSATNLPDDEDDRAPMSLVVCFGPWSCRRQASPGGPAWSKNGGFDLSVLFFFPLPSATVYVRRSRCFAMAASERRVKRLRERCDAGSQTSECRRRTITQRSERVTARAWPAHRMVRPGNGVSTLQARHEDTDASSSL